MLQQLEVPHDATISVNDCLRPVSRFYDRIDRPEQLIPAALEAMRVLTDPAETGAVTLALPEDVQVEALGFPDAFLERRVWRVYRQPPAPKALATGVELIRSAERPLIVAGGGVIYSDATAALRGLVEATGIPVCETQAGRGPLVSDHPLSLGAVGATGTAGAMRMARDAGSHSGNRGAIIVDNVADTATAVRDCRHRRAAYVDERPHAATVADQRELALADQLKLLLARRHRCAWPAARTVARHDPRPSTTQSAPTPRDNEPPHPHPLPGRQQVARALGPRTVRQGEVAIEMTNVNRTDRVSDGRSRPASPSAT